MPCSNGTSHSLIWKSGWIAVISTCSKVMICNVWIRKLYNMLRELAIEVSWRLVSGSGSGRRWAVGSEKRMNNSGAPPQCQGNLRIHVTMRLEFIFQLLAAEICC